MDVKPRFNTQEFKRRIWGALISQLLNFANPRLMKELVSKISVDSAGRKTPKAVLWPRMCVCTCMRIHTPTHTHHEIFMNALFSDPGWSVGQISRAERLSHRSYRTG